MADGPWTAYQQPAADNADGPWTKYKPDASGPAIGSRRDQDRLPSAGPASAPGQTIPTMTIKPEPAGALERFATGVADPFVGAAQLAAHAIPAPVGKVLEKADDWMADATGSPRSPRDLFSAKGADAAVEQREKAIQKSEPPGTDWWRMAGNVASPANYAVPARALGVANTARRVGSAVLQGATTGMLQPTDGKDFGSEKLTQGVVGGTVGGAVHAGTEAARAIGKWVWGLYGEAAGKSRAIKAQLSAIEEDMRGSGPTFQDMLDLANKTPDKNLVLADVVGANAKDRLGAVARAGGAGAQFIKKFLTDRDLDTATQVTGDLGKHLGEGAAFYADESLKAARTAAAKPLFNRAFANNMPLDSIYLQDILATNPLIKEGIRRGFQIEMNEAQGEFDAATGSYRPIDWADYGIKNVITDPQTGEITLELGQVPNLRLWHTAKQGLDAKIEELENANDGEPTRMSVSVDILRRGILRELDRLSDGYKEAREAWAGPTLARVALKFGQDFAKYTPEFIEHKMGEMSASEREFARLGLANTLRKTLLMTGERGDEVRKLRLPYIKLQLRAFFDSDAAFNRYFESINAEHMMWESWAKVYGGSNSADKLAADQRLHASAASQAFLAGKSLFSGHGIDAMSHAARAAGHFVPHKNAHQNLAEAKLLATPVGSAVSTLQGATNQMPTIQIYPKTVAGAAAAASPRNDRPQ